MRRRFVRTAVLGLAAAALPASATGLSLGETAVPVPVLASSNIELLGTMPDVTAVSLAFASDKPVAYLNTLHGIQTFDISNPAQPLPLGNLSMPHFENESMALAERPDGTKFVIVGVDIVNVAPTATSANHVSGGSASFLVVVDVTNAAAPAVIGQLDTATSTHTVQCVTKTCEIAYTSGAYDGGNWEAIDLRDPKKPVVAKLLKNNVAALKGGPAGIGNHQWDADDAGFLWGSGGSGVAAFDVRDPLNPVTLASTNDKGLKAPYNNFILHNSYRPGGANFSQVRQEATGVLQSGTKETASPSAGNVLLGGEGTFSTWYVPALDAAQNKTQNPTNKIGGGKIEPLDNWNTEVLNTGMRTEFGALCSAHYFDYNNSGFVAQAWYQQGTRILDVRNPRDIKQVGYFFTGHSETWDAKWVPEYKDGKQTGKDTNVVYTIDATRGIDVLKVTLPTAPPASTDAVTAPILPAWLNGTAAPAAEPNAAYGARSAGSAAVRAH